MHITYEGVIGPRSFGGWRILVNGESVAICQEYAELERELARLSRAFRKLPR